MVATVQITDAQLAGTAGSFSRLGFGARGVGMGNAMVAVDVAGIESYYNPAMPAFADRRTVSATYSFLSLDRRLNFLSYNQAVPPMAGFSAGVIYAGVRDIDGRDSDGERTEIYSSSEYQFFFAFSNRFTERLSIGIGLKLYYNNLFRDATTTTVGFDLGALFRATESITIGAAVKEINAKYRWDTSTLYGQLGNVTSEQFPVLKQIGVAYRLPDGAGIASLEVENSSQGGTLIKIGGELKTTEYLTVRAGLDRIETKKDRDGAKPSVGFTLSREVDGFSPSLSFAYVHEPVSSTGMGLLSLSFGF